MKKKQHIIAASLLAVMLSTNTAYAQVQGGAQVPIGSIGAKMNMGSAIQEINNNTKWNPAYEQQGCSEAAWTQLKQQQIQALKAYEATQAPLDQAVMKAGSIIPSSLGLNGCLSSIDNIFNKYKGLSTTITDLIQSSDGILSVFSKALFDKILNSAKQKATAAACEFVNNSIAETERKILSKTGMDKVLGSASASLTNPFGNLEDTIVKMADAQMDKAIKGAIDKK